MIVVIQCAARKQPTAGFLKTRADKPVFFVADPSKAPTNDRCIYSRPDDLSDTGISWRSTLLQYNAEHANNPLRLSTASELYENRAYRQLVSRFGLDKIFILSAGWGLISADFLTPRYDITFSASADTYKRRRNADPYHDLNMLPTDTIEPIVFFGGKDYVPLFCDLTNSVKSTRIVFYNSDNRPVAPGCLTERYVTTTRTNWHYECVNALLNGRIEPPKS